MPEITTTPVAATTAAPAVAEAKPVKAKKTAAKPLTVGKGAKSVKKTVKTTTKATPAEKKATDKSELGAVKIRILKALSKSAKPLTGGQLSDKAEVDPSMIGNQAGYRDPEINGRPVHANNLLNRKFVKLEKHDVDGKDVFLYSITAAGKAALEKASK